MDRTLQAVEERFPGARWRRLYEWFWPAYERWFLREGEAARPTAASGRAALRRHMPELVPIYDHLRHLAGDERAARFLTLWRPAPYLTGCSQAIWTGAEPVLLRNYDYSPALWEGVLLSSAWHGRRVVAMSDCLWGALDGLNDSGLAVALSFGGRRVVGEGFGIPLVLRYLLEHCRDAGEAEAVLRRVPSHMAYNVSVVDAAGGFFTAYLAPDRPPIFRKWPICTNHQEEVHWREHAEATGSVERERFLADLLADPSTTAEALADAFLRPPLYSDGHHRGFGTLYTALYYPLRRRVELRWPGRVLARSLDEFEEGEVDLSFPEPRGAEQLALVLE